MSSGMDQRDKGWEQEQSHGQEMPEVAQWILGRSGNTARISWAAYTHVQGGGHFN